MVVQWGVRRDSILLLLVTSTVQLRFKNPDFSSHLDSEVGDEMRNLDNLISDRQQPQARNCFRSQSDGF